ncbi:protein spire isoform X4 [Monomorium pharaonis]|uniref:protein spire isoform X4 n=1 Tax=Monomorium pharaonis TaxID=307658 RepID=UPI0017463518|nr:protein spire isoform X4 [Monomorium pharaonis]
MSNYKKSPDCEKKTIVFEEPMNKKEDTSARSKYKLDDCLNLQDILLMFDRPVTQEQAWALCYEIAYNLSRLTDKFYEISELSQIILHKDGHIWLENLAGSKQFYVSEEKAIFSLGMIIFKALDFGSNAGEEIALSSDLETLITLMTNCNRACEGDIEDRLQETDDEGIERDSGDTDAEDCAIQRTKLYADSSTCTLKTILQVCARHVQNLHEDATSYYRNIMKAFVEEALNLSQFLEKGVDDKQSQDLFSSNNVDRTSSSLQNINTLDFNDWTDIRIWRAIQASERRLRPLQKESTLRELLMESIKKPPKPLRSSSSRQNTSHIEETSICNTSGESRMIVLGEVPPSQPEQEQESAQDVAAQWLQSEDQRALSASDGVLAAANRRRQDVPPVPQPRQKIAKERSSIKVLSSNRNRKSRRRRITVADITQNGEDIDEPKLLPKPSGRNLDATRRIKKVIPVDFDLKLDAEDDDDDDVDDYNEENFAAARFEEEDEESANPWRKTGGLRLTRNEYHRFCDAQLESYDLATQCPSRRASAKRHATKCIIPLTSLTGTTSLPQSRPQSRQHAGLADSILSQGPSPNISLNPSPNCSPHPRTPRQPRRANTIAHDSKNDKTQDDEWENDIDKKTTLGDMLLDERLSLTLDEIVHIRSVLTKAELESLPVEGRVKEDVEKRRVCFLCLKTRFGLLGPWGQRCRLCKRTVCVKCYSKMRIPTEQFARVPVVLLSPGLLLSPTETENCNSKNSWLRNAGAVGSAPASPASRRKDSALRNGTPVSTPTMTPISTLTPMSMSPSHVIQGLDKRNYKGGSPAALSTTKTFSTSSGPSAEQRMVAERLRGVAVVVCHDCRIMVIQIIKSSRTTRATIRNNVISRLTLNLSPAYI